MKQIEFIKRMVEEKTDPEVINDGIEKLQELKNLWIEWSPKIESSLKKHSYKR